MRIAIIYDTKETYVEFNSAKFREIFKKFFEETGDVDTTFDAIEKQLKLEASRK